MFLMTNSVATFGGGLHGRLRFLHRLIENELNKSNFQSSFDEFWLILSIPPTYVKPKVLSLVEKFDNHYKKLPNSRLSRRYKKIEVSLKASEFSEFQSDAKPIKYKHEFEVEPQFRNLNEVELAKILIDKFLEAGDITSEKLKKDDLFDISIFRDVLNEIKRKIDVEFLEKINVSQMQEVKDESIKRALESRENRRLQNIPKNQLIRDLRVYCNGLPQTALSPYDYQYCEILLNLLSYEGLMCPNYHHLYIRIAQTREEALRNSVASTEWFVNGISVIDYEKYQTLNDKKKAKFVFEAIVAGLKDIAEIDKLDLSKIEKVVEKVREKGLETELVFRTLENKNYFLEINYIVRTIKDKCPVFFSLTDKLTKQTKRIEIGKIEHYKIRFWLQKITLTNKKIKIKSSDSIRGQVNLKGMQTNMEFDIDVLMNPKKFV